MNKEDYPEAGFAVAYGVGGTPGTPYPTPYVPVPPGELLPPNWLPPVSPGPAPAHSTLDDIDEELADWRAERERAEETIRQANHAIDALERLRAKVVGKAVP